MEQWKPIRGYEGLYEVSDQGRVRSLDRVLRGSFGTTEVHRGKIRKLSLRSNYLFVGLHKDGVATSYDVHRLVADAFVMGKTKDRNDVNHKNLNKLDNRAVNLEWVTKSENAQHAWENDACKNHISQRVRKQVLCVETGQVFDSSYQAAASLNADKYGGKRNVGVMARNIRWCCLGNKNTAYKYHWKDVVKEPSTTIPKGSTPKQVEVGGPA